MVDYEVREMKPDDVNNGFLETLENLTTVNLDPSEALEVYEKMANRPEYRMFVAEEQGTGQIIGATTLVVEQKFIHSGATAGHIEDVVTREGYEGNGVASAVVQRCIDEAKKIGCYRVQLECSEDLIPFYERLGFHEHELNMRLDKELLG